MSEKRARLATEAEAKNSSATLPAFWTRTGPLGTALSFLFMFERARLTRDCKPIRTTVFAQPIQRIVFCDAYSDFDERERGQRVTTQVFARIMETCNVASDARFELQFTAVDTSAIYIIADKCNSVRVLDISSCRESPVMEQQLFDFLTPERARMLYRLELPVLDHQLALRVHNLLKSLRSAASDPDRLLTNLRVDEKSQTVLSKPCRMCDRMVGDGKWFDKDKEDVVCCHFCCGTWCASCAYLNSTDPGETKCGKVFCGHDECMEAHGVAMCEVCGEYQSNGCDTLNCGDVGTCVECEMTMCEGCRAMEHCFIGNCPAAVCQDCMVNPPRTYDLRRPIAVCAWRDHAAACGPGEVACFEHVSDAGFGHYREIGHLCASHSRIADAQGAQASDYLA